jgi:hypothetical protein
LSAPQARVAESSRADRLSAVLVALIVAVVLVGFAKNFYLRPWLGTRPLTWLAYAHGFLMTAWLALFVVQLALVAMRNIPLHRRVGEWGASIAAFIVPTGLLTIAAAAERHHETQSIGRFAATFVAYDGVSLLLFGLLVAWALGERTRPAMHRRLMLMAMVALLPPAFGRLTAFALRDGIPLIVLVIMLATVVLCIAIDALPRGRAHTAIVIPGIAIVLVNVATYLAQIFTP